MLLKKNLVKDNQERNVVMKNRIIQDKKYPEMYRIQWDDGEVSDMVNRTRAKDAERRYEEYTRRFPSSSLEEAPRSLTGALK